MIVSVWVASLAGPVAVVAEDVDQAPLALSSATVPLSSSAIGASLTSVTVIVTVAVSDLSR